ncbi:MAG: hypothetical protein KGJ02_03780 [Verrucomicrobiota bacterium]|nr:hypothetical protein [Verrucomicrobiota bacterium]
MALPPLPSNNSIPEGLFLFLSCKKKPSPAIQLYAVLSASLKKNWKGDLQKLEFLFTTGKEVSYEFQDRTAASEALRMLPSASDAFTQMGSHVFHRTCIRDVKICTNVFRTPKGIQITYPNGLTKKYSFASSDSTTLKETARELIAAIPAPHESDFQETL